MNLKLFVCFTGIRAYVLGIALLFLPLMIARYVGRQYKAAESIPLGGHDRVLLLLFASAWLAFTYQMLLSYDSIGTSIELYSNSIELEPFPAHLTDVEREKFFDSLTTIRRAGVATTHTLLNVIIFSVNYWMAKRQRS